MSKAKKVPKPKRVIIRAKFLRAVGRWVLDFDASRLPEHLECPKILDFDTKELAVIAGRDLGRAVHHHGASAQLLIYNKNGQIGKGGNAEASYGCDSKSPG